MSKLVISIADQEFAKTASTGIFNFSLGLVNAFAEIVPEQVRVLANSTQVLPERQIQVDRMDWPVRSLVDRIIWDQLGVYRKVSGIGCDWLFLPKGFASFMVACPVKLAVYMHDIIPLICAERWPGSISFRKYCYLKTMYRATLERADVVFTNTKYTRSEIQRWAAEQDICCPPVHVAGYGFCTSEKRPLEKVDQITVLIRPDRHKRPELCLEYMTRWCEESKYVGDVVCIGCKAGDVSATQLPHWKWLGRIPSDRCLDEMRKSRAVVHFSDYEGFGMPPVESVLNGTCPVYSAIPVAVEVMGSCGCGFQNEEYESFFSAMSEALDISSARIQEWAQILMTLHNWRLVVDRILAVTSHS